MANSHDTVHASLDPKDQAADQANRVADHVEEMAKAALDQARAIGETVSETADKARDFVGTSMKTNPMATLAALAAVGFLLGALWKK
jgi:ElaB/YqjD/DUF883 family membrane-anchored ribosome-binding protein